jgi:hypothetical protein
MHQTSYTVGRIFAVSMRPACLFLANNYFPSDAAKGLAVAFLASSLALMATAADPHRRFYARRFGRGPAAFAVSFHMYVAGLLLMTVLGALLVLGIGMRLTASYAVVAVSVVYFLSERLADECLRVRFFERDLAAWGRLTILRTALQASGLLILAVIVPGPVRAWSVVLVLAAANVAAFGPGVPRSPFRVLSPRRLRLLRWLVRRGSLMLLHDWRVWAVAVLGASIGYLDRLVAVFVDPGLLPLFLLVVMSFSIVPMAVDFYYMSRHRPDFLQQRITLGGALTNREFGISFGGSLVVALVVSSLVLAFSRNGSTFPLEYMALIAVVQASAAVTVIPQQLLYWNQDFHRILKTELSFWSAFGAAMLAAASFDLSLAVILTVTTLSAIGRFGLYAVKAARVPVAAHPPVVVVPHEMV